MTKPLWCLLLLSLISFCNGQDATFNVIKPIEAVIRVPVYDANKPTTDSTNILWVDAKDLVERATFICWNPNIVVASYELYLNSKGEIFKSNAEGGKANSQFVQMAQMANMNKGRMLLTITEVYLNGKVSKANWVYNVKLR